VTTANPSAIAQGKVFEGKVFGGKAFEASGGAGAWTFVLRFFIAENSRNHSIGGLRSQRKQFYDLLYFLIFTLGVCAVFFRVRGILLSERVPSSGSFDSIFPGREMSYYGGPELPRGVL
jgi:hypothetical protein